MNESGQTMLLAIFIVVLLILVVPIINVLNTSVARHQNASTQRDKGYTVAEEGLAYAMEHLANAGQTTWNGYLNGTSAFPAFCQNTDITGADGGHFRILCESKNANPNGNPAEPRCTVYQVYVKSTAWMPGSDTNYVPTRAIEAFVSHKTMGAYLATGLNAPAALEVWQTPTWSNGNSQLCVFNGPIVNHDPSQTTPWILDPCSDNRYPRKFSLGGIEGTATARYWTPPAPTSDNQEYWAFTSLGFSPIIDASATITGVDSYAALADNTDTSSGSRPVCADNPGQAILPSNCKNPSNECGYYDPKSGPHACSSAIVAAVFDGTGSGYDPGPGQGHTIPPGPTVIYVNGNAEFRNVHMDMGNDGAFIVDGDLLLDNNGDLPPGNYADVPSCPSACIREYPGATSCQKCGSGNDRYINLRGFLYVSGNIYSATAGSPNPSYWTFDGAIRVNRTLQLGNNIDMQLTYNDVVNRNIVTSDFDLQVDSETAITAQ